MSPNSSDDVKNSGHAIACGGEHWGTTLVGSNMSVPPSGLPLDLLNSVLHPVDLSGSTLDGISGDGMGDGTPYTGDSVTLSK